MNIIISALLKIAPEVAEPVAETDWCTPDMIMSIVSSILTLLALFVAVRGNFLASKALKDALKIQEQGKNVDLFEKRVALLDEIDKGNLEACKKRKYEIDLLFDDEIDRQVKQVVKCMDALHSAECDMAVYEELSIKDDGFGGQYKDIAEEKSAEMKCCTCDDTQAYNEFAALCKRKEKWYSPYPEVEEYKTYNYQEISERIIKCRTTIDNERKQTVVY